MLDRVIAVIDTETTGLDPDRARIIDLGIVYLERGVIGAEPLRFRFNPGVKIEPEATAIHGIKDEDVAAFPPFREAAAEVAKLLSGVDIAGFNLRGLDLPILGAEFERAKVVWDFNGLVFDARTIFLRLDPRDLKNAARKYLGVEHGEAHGALADAIVTARVLLAQHAAFPTLREMGSEGLARFSAYDRDLVDLAGKLARDGDGDLIFTFGKCEGQKVKEARGFAEWMLKPQQKFSADTKRRLIAELRALDSHPVTGTEIPF